MSPMEKENPVRSKRTSASLFSSDSRVSLGPPRIIGLLKRAPLKFGTVRSSNSPKISTFSKKGSKNENVYNEDFSDVVI